MPAPPEDRDGRGQVGCIEVLRELVAQQHGRCDRHIRVARKIAIDLNAVEQYPGDDRFSGVGRRIIEDLIHERRNIVGDAGFLDEAQHEQHQRRLDRHIGPYPGAPELGQEVRRAHDRTRHQLRKEGDVQRHIGEARLGANMLAAHIDHVAHRLEGVEGNPDRQDDVDRRMGKREPTRCGQVNEAVGEEAEILEQAENGEIAPDRRPERQLRTFVFRADKIAGNHVIQRGTEHDQRQETNIPGGVENITGAKQQILPRQV